MFRGALGDAEIFALTPRNILNGLGGACISTNDELLADRIRCMRSSGGVRKQVPVSKTVNGRMSEAQAAYGLMSLETLDDNIVRNKRLHETYSKYVRSIPGLALHSAAGVSESNYQQAVATVDQRQYGMSAGELVDRLRRRLVSADLIKFSFSSVLTNCAPTHLPGFMALVRTGIELPLGSATNGSVLEAVREVLTIPGNRKNPRV